MEDLAGLLDRLEISEPPTALLQTAVTHGSINQIAGENRTSFEPLATLGDAVLDLLSAERWYHEPGATKESITNGRRREVTRENLGKVALNADLGRALVLGPGGEAQNLRNSPDILAESLEAILGAVYLDNGLDAARELYQVLITESAKPTA